jgi:hypothetical protein
VLWGVSYRPYFLDRKLQYRVCGERIDPQGYYSYLPHQIAQESPHSPAGEVPRAHAGLVMLGLAALGNAMKGP